MVGEKRELSKTPGSLDVYKSSTICIGKPQEDVYTNPGDVRPERIPEQITSWKYLKSE